MRSYELKPGWRAADFAGFAYQQSGDLPQAEHWFTTALQHDPALANAWFRLAQIRLEQHRPNQAIDFLNQALTLSPTPTDIITRWERRWNRSRARPTRSPPTNVSCNCIPISLGRQRQLTACRRPDFTASECQRARIVARSVLKTGSP